MADEEAGSAYGVAEQVTVATDTSPVNTRTSELSYLVGAEAVMRKVNAELLAKRGKL